MHWVYLGRLIAIFWIHDHHKLVKYIKCYNGNQQYMNQPHKTCTVTVLCSLMCKYCLTSFILPYSRSYASVISYIYRQHLEPGVSCHTQLHDAVMWNILVIGKCPESQLNLKLDTKIFTKKVLKDIQKTVFIITQHCVTEMFPTQKVLYMDLFITFDTKIRGLE